MTLTLGDLLVLVGTNFALWMLLSILKPYLGQKGKNVATHEDIQLLVDQVKATTAATEAIKSDIEGRQWVSQEQWKMKTELYIRLMTMLHGFMDEANRGIRAVESGNVSHAVSKQDLKEEMGKIFVLVQIVSPQVMDAMQPLRGVERKVGVNDREYFQEMFNMYQALYFRVAAIARRDLGFSSPSTA